jgi:hypothetical protein
MNRNQQAAPNKFRALIALGALAATITTVACSNQPKKASEEILPVNGKVQPAAMNVAQEKSQPIEMNTALKDVTPVNTLPSKPIAFKSRDYGVSFVYPWQYSYKSAKALANSETMQPKSDGYEGQFALARIDIPKGYYPDTDFDSGYFTVSLNQDLSQEECSAVLVPGEAGKIETETINGTDFQWIETKVGGKGDWSKTRNYVAFANDTCYEMELGVKTSNDQGMVREVNADHVLQRLEAIVKTVKLDGQPQQAKVKPVESATDDKPAVSE